MSFKVLRPLRSDNLAFWLQWPQYLLCIPDTVIIHLRKSQNGTGHHSSLAWVQGAWLCYTWILLLYSPVSSIKAGNVIGIWSTLQKLPSYHFSFHLPVSLNWVSWHKTYIASLSTEAVIQNHENDHPMLTGHIQCMYIFEQVIEALNFSFAHRHN